ncbi:uncharacterized protein LOC124434460 [Xenia sp. Carnegie-2017]|uniref:uncharacterized protein LOC124434460 n=1 Tax=Xenia sp. Carnegie-2017 TaxID=2897299 RepID=UPI001F03E1D3|nr:uncharacterized protein LOC124434460 [Xenia sp. Carnegie-2017]
MHSTTKKINILSFDGGGSRGVMELKILDDVLRLTTIVSTNPESVGYLVNKDIDENEVNFLEDESVRECLIKDMEVVTDPIHPTDVYDMIVGTSTGSLIAFALVGGNKVENNHHVRERMTLEECINMYKDKTREIFPWRTKIFGFPIPPYKLAKVEKALKNKFGDCCLYEFGGKDSSKTVAGAVTKELGNNQNLVMFDTFSKDYACYQAYKVLLASSSAPIYFDNLTEIGSHKYVDGGIGGNCPLAQAIPRAKEIFGENGEHVEITSVLSIAPPSKLETPRDNYRVDWAKYLLNLSTDGNAVFNEVVKQNNQTKTLFQRLVPRGDRLKKFDLDENDAEKMTKKMEDERLKNDVFLVDVVASAMVVFLMYIEKKKNDNKIALTIAAQLAEAAACVYQSKNEFESAIISYETSKRLQEKVSSDITTIKNITYNIANCYKQQGDFRSAIDLFKSNVIDLSRHGDDEKCKNLLVDTLIEIADCYLTTFHYVDAEKYLNEIPEERKKSARVLTYLARCKQQKGEIEKAADLYNEAASYTKDKDSYDKAQILSNLGLCFRSVEQNDEAKYLISKAQEMRKRIKEKTKQENDAQEAEFFFIDGLCLRKKKKYSEAIKKLEEAKAKYDQIGDKISVSLTLRNLAICKSKNESPDSLNYAQQALQMMKKHTFQDNNPRNNEKNPEIAISLSVLGQCLFKAGRFQKAKIELLKILGVMEHLISENHPRLIKIYKLLCELEKKNGENEKAENYDKKKKEAKYKRQNIIKRLRNARRRLIGKKFSNEIERM